MINYSICNEKPQCFSFSSKRDLYKLPCGDIQYFESTNRIIHLYTANSSYEFYGKLNDLEEMLFGSEQHYIRIHQSYLVNFKYIRILKNSEVVLVNGKILPISPNRLKQARQEFRRLAQYRT